MATLGKLFSNFDHETPPSRVMYKPSSVPKNSKFGFLLKYDKCIIKDLDVLWDEISNQYLNEGSKKQRDSLQNIEDFDYH